MKNAIKLFIIVFTLIGLNACFNAPTYNSVPEIKFNRWQAKSFPVQMADNSSDSLSLYFDFTDGEGDLGDTTTGVTNIFIKDLKTNLIDKYSMDPVPQNGSVNDISGTIEVKLGPNLLGRCLLPNISKPIDTTKYEVYIMDRAGNKSNTIITSEIQFECK